MAAPTLPCARHRPGRRRARSHWSDAARCRSNVTERMPASNKRAHQLRRKQRMGDDGVDGRGAGGRAAPWRRRSACRPTRRCRRPAAPAGRRTAPDRRKRSRPSGRRGASCARPRAPGRAGRRDRCTQGRDSSSGPTTTVAGSMPAARSASAIAGIAERLSASMPGKTSSNVLRAMQMRIDRDDAVDSARQQPADHLLADRLAFVKGRVLPHVAEIGRDQHQPLGAAAPQALRPRTAAPAACRWADRARHRRWSLPPPGRR